MIRLGEEAIFISFFFPPVNVLNDICVFQLITICCPFVCGTEKPVEVISYSGVVPVRARGQTAAVG